MKVTIRLVNGTWYEVTGEGTRVHVTAKHVQCSGFDRCVRTDSQHADLINGLLSVQWPMQAVEAVLYGG